MQEMGGGVVAGSVAAGGFAHPGGDGVAVGQVPFHLATMMEDELAIVAGEGALAFDLQPLGMLGLEAAGGAGPLALGGHLPFEAFHVHLQAAGLGDVGGEIDGKSVGVVEAEGQFTGQGVAVGTRGATRRWKKGAF